MIRFSGFARRFTAACIILLALFTAVTAVFLPYGAHFTPLLFVIGAAAVALLWRPYKKYRLRLRPVWRLAILTLLCAAVKLGFVLLVRVQPLYDDYTFFLAASQLAEGGFKAGGYLPHYIAMFPHVFGYPAFLSLMFRIFGVSTPLLAAVVNVVLSVVSMLGVYRLAGRLISEKAAVLAALMWIFCPSQTVYNIFVYADTYYTTLLIAALCLFDALRTAPAVWAGCALALLAGAALALCESARPVGAIMLMAICLYELFFTRGEGLEKPQRRPWLRRLAPLLLCAAVFFGGRAVNTASIEKNIGAEPGSSMGYTMCVGFNAQSGGTWNEGDSELLENAMAESVPFSAAKVNSRLLGYAKARINALGAGGVLRLLPAKLRNLMGGDGMCIDYGSSVFRHIDPLKSICNAYWGLLWLLAAVGVWLMAKRDDGSLLWAAAMYPVGVSVAHMLTEVALRYHYSMVPMIILLAAFGADRLELKKKTV